MHVVDRLYEAALIPEAWPDTLAELELLSGSDLASLWLISERFPLRGVAPKIPRDVLARFLTDLWRDSASVQWVVMHKPPHFTYVLDHLDPNEIQGDLAWKQLEEIGLSAAIGVAFPMPSGELMSFMMARRKERGRYAPDEIGALDGLRPHLARVGMLAARLGLERARAMVATLEQIGLATAVISANGRVLASNALLEKLPAVLAPTAFGGIALNDRVKNDQFLAALARVGAGPDGPAVSIPIPGGEQHPPLIVHLLPVRGQAQDIFSGGHVLMVVSTIARKATPGPELLSGLFNLSPAEARLVSALLTGATLAEIAARTGVAVATLRNQMRAVLAKTGVRRQAELTQLLAGL